MIQKIKVEAIVEVPPEYVVIERTEYEELKEQQLIGRCWTMSRLEEHTGMGASWLKENLLYVPKFKKQLEKFVHYPKSQGEKWSFQATKMARFLEENYYSIFNQ